MFTYFRTAQLWRFFLFIFLLPQQKGQIHAKQWQNEDGNMGETILRLKDKLFESSYVSLKIMVLNIK